ncbi:MAG: 6-bladed beta-propeller, partial [Prevotellaceae bacterium]|nr:6-bladed beta-propeller [Prevotellaceae bacterium]
QTFFKNFELDAIVPIETTDDYLVNYIKRAIRWKDKLIFLTVSYYIFVTDIETGKVEAFINRLGAGPGESHVIYDIAIDERTEQILANNDYGKLLFFDMNGKFLREVNLGYGGSNMTCHNGKALINETGRGYACTPYEFHVYDIDKDTRQKIGDNKSVDFHFKGYGKHVVYSKNIWFIAPLDYNLYRLNNGEIEIPYTVTVKNPITKRLIEKSKERSFKSEIEENKIIYGFSSPVETDRFMLATTNLTGIVMINKQTSEITWEKYIKEEQLGLTFFSYYPVDRDENRVMFIIEAIDWLRDVAAHPEKVAPKWKEQISKMNIVEDSNPILLFYKEKKEPE